MYQPVSGDKVSYNDYFTKGNPKLHLIGIFGGMIWAIGMLLNMKNVINWHWWTTT